MKKSLLTVISTIIFPLITVMLQCCGEEPTPAARKAVIEGYFRSGEYPAVMFSSSVVPGIRGNITDALINWGKVTITDGDTAVVLTGQVDHTYTPPYVYYTFDMTGIPGRTYTISAEFKDLKAFASVRMLQPVKIDSITTTPTVNDTLRSATLHFTSPVEGPAFFYLSMKKNERNTRMLPCMMGTIKTDFPGTHYSIPLLRPRIKSDPREYVSQLIVGEEWVISLNRVERPVYDFWKAYDEMVMFSTSPFISTSASLPSNINGGYGIWSVEGSYQMRLSVK